MNDNPYLAAIWNRQLQLPMSIRVYKNGRVNIVCDGRNVSPLDLAKLLSIDGVRITDRDKYLFTRDSGKFSDSRIAYNLTLSSDPVQEVTWIGTSTVRRAKQILLTGIEIEDAAIKAVYKAAAMEML